MNPHPIGGLRGRIVRFTRASRTRLLWVARNCPELDRPGDTTFLTLTYPEIFPADGHKVKEDLRVMQQWLSRRGLKGLWVLEFQERGAPHFHIVLSGRVDKDEVSAQWYKVVDSGDEKHLRAGTRIEALKHQAGVSSYMAKYAAKSLQKTVPAGYTGVGRFWGVLGKLKPVQESLPGTTELVRIARRAARAARRNEAGDRAVKAECKSLAKWRNQEDREYAYMQGRKFRRRDRTRASDIKLSAGYELSVRNNARKSRPKDGGFYSARFYGVAGAVRHAARVGVVKPVVRDWKAVYAQAAADRAWRQSGVKS